MKLAVTDETLFLVAQAVGRRDSDIEEWPAPEQVFWHAWQFSLEVSNGGFHQYLFNTSGNYTAETLDALSATGVDEVAALLKHAIEAFPNAIIPQDVSARRELLSRVDPDFLRSLDDQFNKIDGGDRIDSSLVLHVRDNLKDTILPMFLSEASEQANVEFQKKNYDTVVDLLSPFELHLKGAPLAKLKLARKKT